MSDIPRRCRLDQFVPAERAIYDATQAVEAMPADVRLTDAVNLLEQARRKVADFVDGLPAAARGPVPRDRADIAEILRLREVLHDITKYVLPTWHMLTEPCVKLEHAEQLRQFAKEALGGGAARSAAAPQDQKE